MLITAPSLLTADPGADSGAAGYVRIEDGFVT
jgi:hypothetical protein